MRFQSIKEMKGLRGKRILLRADFNVPLKNGRVQDDFKIRRALPTIKYLLEQGVKIILVSHLGRPRGFDAKLSLEPVKKILEKFLNRKIKFVKFSPAENYFVTAGRELAKMNSGQVAMLENVRFGAGEEKNDPAFAKKLAALADVFVLDGFAVAHRAAASVSGVAKYLPACAGLLLEEEISGLSMATQTGKKPFVLILGGVKMETKIPVLKNLLDKADFVLLGGGMANTFFWANGASVGSSLIDKKFKKEILFYASKKKVILPVDVVVGLENGREAEVIDARDGKFAVSGRGRAILDIGPDTIRLYSRYIKKANTLVWNGAMGYFEKHPYEYGTYAVARLLFARAKGNAFGICGGGETAEAVRRLNLSEGIDLVSTGGGAMLEFLSGKKLPGIEAVKI